MKKVWEGFLDMLIKSDKLTLSMVVVTFLSTFISNELSFVIMFVFMYIAIFKLLCKKDVISFGIVVAGYGIGIGNEGYLLQFQIFFIFGLAITIVSFIVMHYSNKEYKVSIVDLTLTSLMILLGVLNYSNIHMLLLAINVFAFSFAIWYQLVLNKDKKLMDMPNNIFGVFSYLFLVILKIVIKK